MSRTGTRYLLNNYRILLKIPQWEYVSTLTYEGDDDQHFRLGDFRLHLSSGKVMLVRSTDQTQVKCIYKNGNCSVESYGYGYKNVMQIPTLKSYEEMCKYVQI